MISVIVGQKPGNVGYYVLDDDATVQSALRESNIQVVAEDLIEVNNEPARLTQHLHNSDIVMVSRGINLQNTPQLSASTVALNRAQIAELTRRAEAMNLSFIYSNEAPKEENTGLYLRSLTLNTPYQIESVEFQRVVAAFDANTTNLDGTLISLMDEVHARWMDNPQARAWIQERDRDRIQQALSHHLVSRRTLNQRRLADINRRVSALIAEQAGLLRESESLRQRISLQDENVNNTGARAIQEYQALWTMPKILSIEVDREGRVILFTKRLLCENPNTGKIHEIGAFKITIDCEQAQISWENLTRKVNGTDHPHIHGSACLGNLAEALPPLFAGQHLSALAAMAIRFVESVDPNDAWGSGIVNWPLVGSLEATTDVGNLDTPEEESSEEEYSNSEE